MNLRQIEVFRAFMMAGTISDAAKMLGVSQPAVSSLLHHILDRSGIRLFEQVKGRLLPTQEAQTLFAEIQTTWKSVERVQRLCRDLSTGRASVLRIAASPSLGPHIIPSVVKGMEQAFPRLSVSLELFTPTLLIDCLAAGDADIGIASHAVDHPAVLTKRVGSAPMVCVMRPEHPLAARASVRIADLAGLPLVSHSLDMPEGALIAEAFRCAGIEPRSQTQVRSGQSACWFVRSGAGVALVGAVTIAGDTFPELISRPIEPCLSLDIVILRNPLRALSKAARAFSSGIEAYCSAHFPQKLER